jgi:hypothetical protein
LGFVKRLHAQPAIGAARLLHHEINSQDGNQPIRSRSSCNGRNRPDDNDRP